MGEQAVITDAESQSPDDPVQKDRNEQPPSREEEECGHSADVKQRQHGRDRPVQSILVGLIVPRTITLQDVCSGHSLGISYTRPPGRSLLQIATCIF